MKRKVTVRYIIQFFSILTVIVVLEASQLYASSGTKTSTKDSSPERYDIVVIGSEIEGILLAKAAHDLGLKVIVLDPREKPGGQLIQGKMFVLDEPVDKNRKKSLVQGELKELYEGYKDGSIRKDVDFESYYNKLAHNIPMFNDVKLVKLQTEKQSDLNSIKSLTYKNSDNRYSTVAAQYWVENTDFNALTSLLKEKRIPGVETIYAARRNDYMASTYMLKFKNVDWEKLYRSTVADYPITKLQQKYGPNTYVNLSFGTGFSNIMEEYQVHNAGLRLRGMNSTYQHDGEAVINGLLVFDVDPANKHSVSKAIKKAQAETPHILKFLQSNIPGYEHAELNGYPEYLYIRDYNRYETQYILRYSDIMASQMFWDNVSVGGYPVDIQGTRNVPKGIGFGFPSCYGVPLRSFELKSYENVLVAGKNIGASAKAYGSARVMPTTGLAAETIGIILGHELKNKRLRELTPADFQRIHRYLKNEHNIELEGN